MGLDQIPENWIGVIATIAGGLLVGIFALISKYIDKTTESKTITRNKLEELHYLLSGFVLVIEGVHDEAYRIEPGQIGPRTVAENFKKMLFDPMTKMTTLQNLYAPRTSYAFEELSDLAVDYVVAATEFAGTADCDNTRLDECYTKMLAVATTALEEVESVIFRSNLVPNQSFLDRIKASWKYAGRRAKRARKSSHPKLKDVS